MNEPKLKEKANVGALSVRNTRKNLPNCAQKENKGITLVALIITIIILLILAVVAIQAVQEDGILQHAKNSRDQYAQAELNEQATLEGYLTQIEGNINGGKDDFETVTLAEAQSDTMLSKTTNSKTTDIYGNTIKIPAGFKILVDSTTVYNETNIDVTKGIVIQDANENEFVWIPVGTIKTSETEQTDISLARYVFDVTINTSTYAIEGTGAIKETHTSAEDQIVDPALTAMGDNCYFKEGRIEGVAVDSEGNDTKGYALNIGDFIAKASTGYYIGRYEARTTSTTERTETSELTEVTTKKENAVYNYITQIDATSKCQSMYTNKPFTTDLVNSFAWDTAIAFIQEFEDNDYSKQISLNNSFSSTGTVGQVTEDKMCNIYDMASNCTEWNTETCSTSRYPCVSRGNHYDTSILGTSVRSYDSNSGIVWNSFRPLLYL